VVNHDFETTIVDATQHRPWPMPDRAWVMTQTWHDLLFAHWPIDPTVVRRRVPNAIPLDLFDGVAWIGIVPFHMTNVAPRGVPSLPWISRLPELNVRTYVRVDGKSGVYFFSLDAGRALAVHAARLLFNLPYHTASMRVQVSKTGVVTYLSDRQGAPPASFSAAYRATTPPFRPAPGTLEHFLTERYCLYHVTRDGEPYRLEIHHPPWSLQLADAEISRNTMAAAAGMALPPAAPLLHFVKRQDMVAWMPERMNGPGCEVVSSPAAPRRP
jgi:uncharacterized protein YqjF (DUF2071 family)